MQNSPQTIRPIDVPRPKGSRRIETYSPKLGRRLHFYNRAAFTLWLVIESDPLVRIFCERPGFLQVKEKCQLSQFWVQYAEREEILMLAVDDTVTDLTPAPIGLIDTALPVRIVALAELAASRTWTNNWERMMPLVTANRALVSRALLDEILVFVADATQLSRIEREFSTGDPILVRAAVFTLLHSGRLCAPALQTQALSLITAFLPVEKFYDSPS